MSKNTKIGVDWRDLGENIFSGVHTAGKLLASAFGAGALVAPIENLESPILKDWAKSSPASKPSIAATIVLADYAAVAYNDPKKNKNNQQQER